MTDTSPESELGPQPTPEAGPPEPNPGGPDAVDGGDDLNVIPDLPPESNPALDDAPTETREGEDTDTEATKHGEHGQDVDPAQDSPA
ncbi:MAG: hypothetical protein F2667_06970 [Actinobacteria bacterium]|uniref:Unannotated protein n=1 Tax=freshwater metagenome TaxID=449393 RepID=A0A6J6QIN8_9ZZZZ|nr:hypothetical protein [Actinomycetota bacterium]